MNDVDSAHKITYSARKNADGTYRGLAWGDGDHPLLVVGISMDEDFWTKGEAIAAAKAEAKRLGLIQSD